MRIFEKVACLLVVIGLVLRFLLISGGSFLICISLLMLAVLYLFFGFLLLNGVRFRDMFKKTAYGNVTFVSIGIAVWAGYTMAMTCIGILFLIEQWPASNIMGYLAVTFFVPLLVISSAKRKGKYKVLYHRIFSRILIMASMCMLLVILPKKFFLEVMYRDHPAYIQAQEELWKDPSNQQLQEKREIEWSKVRHHG